MSLFKRLKVALLNKITLYIISRYFVFFIQFVASMFLAVKLGPYYFGIWGFILLLITYFDLFNLGIPNSTTVLLVQYKNETVKNRNIETTSVFLIALLGIFVVALALYYYIWGISWFNKYQVGSFFYGVCFIAILVYFNNLFSKIYRVKGRIFEIALFQSIVPVLTFIVLFFAKDRVLLYVLLGAYILGQLFSLLMFVKGKRIQFDGDPSVGDAKKILTKGFFLFIYSSCFYLIVLSTRTIISAYYSVEEFGYFTFAYTLANSVLLLLEAFSYLITPKLLDKVNSPDVKQVEATINSLRDNYVSLSHGLMYLAICLFPILLYFIPKYSNTLSIINLIALTLLLYTNSFGYISLLMARNREKIIAINSFLVLILNILIAFVLVKMFHVKFNYVVISTMCSYLVYSYLLVFFGMRELNQSRHFRAVIRNCFPLKLLIPFIVAFVIILLDLQIFIFIPGTIFVILNINSLKSIFKMSKKIINNPSIIDL